MSYQAVKEYLAVIQEGYKKSPKHEKTRILTEASRITGLSRKHVVRMLGLPPLKLLRRKSSGRPKKYPFKDLLPHIQFLWNQMERISASRMKEAYSDWLHLYQNPEFTQAIRFMIDQMSVSTLERILRQIRGAEKVTKGLSTTRCPARFMKNKIPLNTFDQKIDRPGFMQSDTVAHCGNTTAGQYISSVTLTDIYSAWTEIRAIFTKQGHEVRKCFTALRTEIVFEILAINTDSGSEFLNSPVLQFINGRDGQKKIAFTRSRPYQKNDNCYVEQKNFTHVRELFGYERFEDEELIELMNEIYRDYWNPLQNFFIPTFKLKEKMRVGSKIVKKYGRPETPYNRLINSSQLTNEQKEKLKEQKKALNPFTLKTEMEAKLETFFERVRRLKAGKAA